MEQRGYRHVHFDGLNDFYVERDFSVPDGLTLPPNVFDYFVPREIADLRAQVTGMRNQAASLDEEIASLRAVYQDALRAVESLAAENRRLGNQSLKLANESGRYRKVADQLRNELTVLNRWLEPMHAMHEQLERVRRHYAEELGLLRAEMSRQYETMQGARNSADAERRAVEARLQASADAERRAVEARLQAVYLSRSWLLTKPWRATGRWIKRLVR